LSVELLDGGIFYIGGSADRNRNLETSLQHGFAALIAWISTTGTCGNHLASTEGASQNAISKLTTGNKSLT
jgi:hypothetical protein